MKKRRRSRWDQRVPDDPDLARLSDAVGLASLVTFDADTARALYGGSGPAKPTRVVIEIDAERAGEARGIAWGNGQKFRPSASGGVQVAFRCDDFASVIARVLRFGSHVRVTEPAALVALVVRTLDTALAERTNGSKRRLRR